MPGFQAERLIDSLAPFRGAANLWIAFSGGLDSTALLNAAAEVRTQLPGALRAVHVDHGVHPSSADWAAHCESVCRSRSVPLMVRRLQLAPTAGESLEAVAREARYRTFAALLEPGDLLLTAHTQDDQAETLLLALVRGSGVHGLAAMPAVAELGRGRLVRPLLDVSRGDLERYARSAGLQWLEDPSNESHSFDRNYIRHRVLQPLRERWPAISATLSRSAAHCAEAAGMLDGLAVESLAGLGGQRPGTLSISGLAELDLPLRKAVLRLWIRRRGFRVPDRNRLDRISREVIPARPDAGPLVAWSGCEIRRYRDDLFALPPLPALPLDTEILWDGARLELPLGLGVLERAPHKHDDPLSDIGFRPLRVRFGIPGLCCRRPASPHSRPLKKLCQEGGIPPWLRAYIPMLFDSRRLVELVGLCGCDPAGGTDLDEGATIDRAPGADSMGRRTRWTGHPWESYGFFR